MYYLKITLRIIIITTRKNSFILKTNDKSDFLSVIARNNSFEELSKS